MPFTFLLLLANKPDTNAIVMTSQFPEMLVGTLFNRKCSIHIIFVGKKYGSVLSMFSPLLILVYTYISLPSHSLHAWSIDFGKKRRSSYHPKNKHPFLLDPTIQYCITEGLIEICHSTWTNCELCFLLRVL